MPSKSPKGGRSSKTARVLSLLTDPASNGTDHAAEDEEVTSRTPARPDDRATQDQIRDALVGELFGRRSPAPRKSGTRRNARSQEDRAKTQTHPEDEPETEILNAGEPSVNAGEPSVRPFAPPVVRPEDVPQDAPAENVAPSAQTEEIPQYAQSEPLTEELPQNAPYAPEPSQYAPQNPQTVAPQNPQNTQPYAQNPQNPQPYAQNTQPFAPQYAQEPVQPSPQYTQPVQTAPPSMEYVPPVESITQSVQYAPEPSQYAPQNPQPVAQNPQNAQPYAQNTQPVAPQNPPQQYAQQPQQPSPPQYAQQTVAVQEPKPPVDFQPQQPVQNPPPQQYAQQPQQPVAPSPAPQQPAEFHAPGENPQPQNAADDTDEEDPDDFICYNLTQALVEEKAEKYMSLFGMCTCKRCRVDVTAIALSHLPSKYVATQSREVVPLLSLYEGQHSAQVITEVMNACKKVMSRPHHGR